MFTLLITLISLILLFLVWQTHFIKKTVHPISLGLPHKLTIMHLSDLHGKTRFINGKLVDLVLKNKPDILFITGDLVSRSNQLPSTLKAISRISQTGIPIFFVPGNYEREELRFFRKRKIEDKDYRRNMQQLKKYAYVLENNGVTIDVKGTSLSVYGFDNSIYGLEQDNTDSLPASDVTCYLAHSPSIISLIEENQLPYHLLLVGHTHGGQIRFLNKTIGAYKNFHTGLKQMQENQYFFISRGLGTVKIPLRLNCYPEIAVFHLS